MVALADGRRVLIRALGPQDAVALGDVYAALGHRDQRMRFSRSGLPAAEAHALAAAELGRARCGVIAFDPGAAPPRPVAAAVCVPDGTGPAEVALAVLGSHQGARLGRALLADLLAAACQAGLPVLRAVIRRDNAPALSLFRSLGCLLVERPGPDELVIEIATDGTMPGWPGGAHRAARAGGVAGLGRAPGHGAAACRRGRGPPVRRPGRRPRPGLPAAGGRAVRGGGGGGRHRDGPAAGRRLLHPAARRARRTLARPGPAARIREPLGPDPQEGPDLTAHETTAGGRDKVLHVLDDTTGLRSL